MAYSFSEKDGIEILQVDNLLNPLDNQEIIKEIEEKIKNASNTFVVDLSAMDYINSSGLTFLISILTRSRNAGGEVVIANLSENIQQIFLITRLNSAFSVYSNVQMAVQALQMEQSLLKD